MDKYIRLAKIGAVALLMVLAFLLGGRTSVKEKVVTDTRYVVVHDTVNVFEPVCLSSMFIGYVQVPVETERIVESHDTTYVTLPMERKVYQDSSYRAVVSGVMPSLDSIQVFNRTQYVYTTETKTVTRKSRYSLGVTIGYGAVYDSRQGICFGPGMMAGVQLRF